ncbi:MAG: glycosyltransferase family 2 protein [Lachnospiraceae bacterium]|nr:glycosyltransferase family 2 protein [Lachnospiraceae bacterium]
MEDKRKVSFVIPCYRSEQTLAGVVTEIEEVMKGMDRYAFEIVLVNDGSPDGTCEEIRRIIKERKGTGAEKITGIGFSRNFGQHAALMAGISRVSGDIVVCLDDDGQTPASEVGKLLNAIEEGHDAVYARYPNKHHSAFRNFGSRMNDRMMRIMLNKPKDLYISSYFAVKRFVADEMVRYTNPYPYVQGLLLRTTKDIVNVDVEHRSRERGTSGYTLGKLLNLWINGFTAFSVKPLRIATMFGALMSVAGFIYGIATIIRKLIGVNTVLGFSALMSVLTFACGLILVMLGLIGEYIGRIYLSLNMTPQYVIREETSSFEPGIRETSEDGAGSPAGKEEA